MAFDKLRQLKCFPELHDKVIAGVPIENISEWVQDDCKEYVQTKRESLTRMLYRYKESIPSTKLAIPEPLYIHKKIEKLRRGTNELEELEKLYLLQMSRISSAVELEDRIKFRDTKLWKDVELAKNILVEAAKLKVEIGIYDRQGHNVNITGTLEHTHKEFLDSMEPERRRKLGEVGTQLLDAMKEMLTEGDTTDSDTSINDEIPQADFEVIESD